MTRGRYIVFEGVNGSGKSTLVAKLSQRLRSNGIAAATLHSPGRVSPMGAVICDVFEQRQQLHPQAMLWAFIAEAVDLESHVETMLKNGVHVLCDRHTMFSARVYQPRAHNDTVIQLALQLANLTPPDALYIVDVPADVALARTRAKTTTRRKDPYESDAIEAIEQARQAYLDHVYNYATTLCPVRVLDGIRAIADNVELIQTDLET